MESQAELEFIDGDRRGQVVPLLDGRTVIGRQVGDLLIEDKEVSSIHAIISFERGGWYLMDLGSTNGVFVDDEVKLEVRLRDGMVLRFGRTSARFKLPEGAPDGPDHDEGFSGSTLDGLKRVEPEGGVDVGRHSVSDQPALASTTKKTEALSPEAVDYLAGVHTEARVEVSLEIVEGVEQGLVRKFKQDSILIGRLNTDMVVRDSDVSRRHTIIEVFDEAQIYLRDLNSTNGTFVNGRRVSSVRLRNGDQIRLGRCLLRFSYRS